MKKTFSGDMPEHHMDKRKHGDKDNNLQQDGGIP